MSQELTIKTAALTAKPANVIAFYVSEAGEPAGQGAQIWASTGLNFKKLSAATDFIGKAGQVLDIVSPANTTLDRLLVLGAGKPDDTAAHSAPGYRDRGGSFIGKIAGIKGDKISVYVDGLSPQAIAGIAAGMTLRHYKFDKYKTKKPANGDNGQSEKLTITLHVEAKAKVDAAVADAMATVVGTILARELVNEPPNVLGPVEFAEQARSLTKLGIDVEILTPTEMKKLGMGALLAVAQGSERPARLAIMQWHGGRKKDAPIAFVGKGVVFDTGGISIKPAASMEDMKGDMGGAAAVTGLMKCLATRKAKVNAVGIIGLVENMPDGKAYRPGDIVTSMSGQTIEIINTDAEGRLVLADALWYTQNRFKPKFMVNLATLTGAILVALGQEYAGMFSNNDELAQNLYEAGMASGEKLWRMPLSPTYDKLVDSRFADMKNTGGRNGGSITAAQFLQRYANETPWAHLDIAGTAFAVPANEVNTSWGSGFGVQVLDQMVRDKYES